MACGRVTPSFLNRCLSLTKPLRVEYCVVLVVLYVFYCSAKQSTYSKTSSKELLSEIKPKHFNVTSCSAQIVRNLSLEDFY